MVLCCSLGSTGFLDEKLEAALGVQMINLQVTESGPRQLIDKWRYEAAPPNLLEALYLFPYNCSIGTLDEMGTVCVFLNQNMDKVRTLFQI